MINHHNLSNEAAGAAVQVAAAATGGEKGSRLGRDWREIGSKSKKKPTSVQDPSTKLSSPSLTKINSSRIVLGGFPLFLAGAALSNKLASCGELTMFLACRLFFSLSSLRAVSPSFQTQIPSFTPPPPPTLHYYHLPSQRNKSKAAQPRAARSRARASPYKLETDLFLFHFH